MWGLPGDGPLVMTIGNDDSAANDGDSSGLGLEQDEATTFMITDDGDRNGSSGEEPDEEASPETRAETPPLRHIGHPQHYIPYWQRQEAPVDSGTPWRTIAGTQ